MFVVKYRRVFFLLSGLLVLASLLALWRFGLKLGTDFTGGSVLEVVYQDNRPGLAIIRDALIPLGLGNIAVQPVGDQGLFLRLRTITPEEKQQILAALNPGGRSPFTEKQFSAIGPTLGQELAHRGVIAVILVVLLIILFIAFAFRQVSRPVSSWVYGVMAFVALLHDLIIPTGVFAVLGHYYGVEVDALFLTGLLTILGLSVHDTIVVFDRIRENLRRRISPDFTETVGRSLSETFTRSINTSMTIIFVLLVLLFWGAESTRYFSLLMAVGVFVGTYSSIFIASPLLVVWNNRRRTPGR